MKFYQEGHGKRDMYLWEMVKKKNFLKKQQRTIPISLDSKWKKNSFERFSCSQYPTIPLEIIKEKPS